MNMDERDFHFDRCIRCGGKATNQNPPPLLASGVWCKSCSQLMHGLETRAMAAQACT